MSLISSTIPNLIGGVSQQPYTIRMASQCETMENCYPSVVEFLKRRPGSVHVAKILNETVTDAAVHIIDRDSTEQYVVVAVNNTLKIFGVDGTPKTVNFAADTAYLNVLHPSTETSFLTINDYTFFLNKTVKAAMGGTITPTRQPEALVFVKQASYATDYHITLDGTTFTHSTEKDDKNQKLSSTTISQDLANKINAHGAYTCHLVKSTLWITRKDGGKFTAVVSDSRSNTHLSVTTDRVQRFSDLPTVAPNGYITQITGDQSSSFDNYFCKFETNDGGWFDTGVWVETVKPGITDSLNAATMPHALVREADGTFTFKTLDWTKRKCGDEDSAPSPSFINRKISSIFFYRNRLGLLASESCILSEAGKFFNFFATTVTTIVDSDPIDVAASHTKAANLYHAAAFSEGLLLFSDQTQFLLEHDDVLSTKTVAVKPITDFECAIKAQPISAGKNIFFATGRGDFSGVREYYVEEDSSMTDAADITSHIPHYIRGDIHKLVSSTNEDCLFALPSEERHTMALYKYFWNGREKLQSSWSKWRFSGEVLSAAFLGSSLLIITQYEGDGVYLERMYLEPGHTEPGGDFEYCLDRKVTERGIIAFTHNRHTKRTTITFPYRLPAKPVIVTRPPMEGENDTGRLPVGVDFEILEWSGNTATVNGILEEGSPFIAGIPFTSIFEFSPQIIREDSGNGGKLAVTEGRLQLRNFTLTYGKTGYFEVHVTPEYRETNTRVFSGRIIGHGANVIGQPVIPSGTFRFPVLSRSDTTKIELTSDSFLPFQITSAGWEGFYHIRSRRV